MITLKKVSSPPVWGWPGSRGGGEGACVGSGICGNQMCWQLREKWQSGVGDRGGGFGSILAARTAAPLLLPSPLEPLLFLCTHPLQLCCPSPVSLYPCIESLAGLEGEKSPRPLFPHPTALSSWRFTFLLLVSLPSSTPSFSFCLLPQFLSLLWLTPSPTPTCRRLARWAGASCSCK